MNPADPSAFVVATPPGEGALHAVTLLGPRAAEAMADLFQPARHNRFDLREGALAFGRLVAGGAVLDEVVLAVLPVRVGGQPVFHLTCHGGPAVLSAIVKELAARRLDRLTSVDLVGLLVRAGRFDAVQAEAARLLPGALTWQAVAMLGCQLRGRLSRCIDEVMELDEAAADRALDALLATADYGCALVRPVRVALVGRPNVGKSSLMNHLVGYRRSIVSERRGTTVDRVGVLVELAGAAVELIDTGGIMAEGDAELDDPIHRGAAEASWRAVEEAELSVLVREAGLAKQRDALAEELSGRAVLTVHNKADLLEQAPAADPALYVSAKTGAGIDALLRAIIETLFPTIPEEDAPTVFTQRQRDLLQSARSTTGKVRRGWLRQVTDGA